MTKGNRYPVPPSATGFSDASLFSLTTRQGYLLYAAQNTLYGYDFRKGAFPVKLRSFADEEITAIYNDIISEQQMEDHFYIATYKQGEEEGRGGILRKYAVTDTPERIEITEELKWKGFPHIINLCYKQF